MNVRGAIGASLRLLENRDRRLLGLALLAQSMVAVLDLIGVLLLGMSGAMAVAFAQQLPPPRIVRAVVDGLGLGGLASSTVIPLAAGSAAAVLLAKSLLTPFVSSRVLKFLARRETMVSFHLTRRLFARPLVFVQQRSSQETSLTLFQGANAATVSVLGQALVIGAEVALLGLLALVLLVINPVVALGSIAFFAGVGFGLHRLVGDRAAQLTSQRRRADVASLVSVQELVGAYREITVADRRSLYIARIKNLRERASTAAAGSQLIASLPKFVAEAALILGAFALAATLFATNSMAVAAGTFAIFLATATRVMPSLLRLQTAALSIRAAASLATPVYELAADLGNPAGGAEVTENPAVGGDGLGNWGGHRDFIPSVEVRGVSFAYPGAPAAAVHNVSLVVGAGTSAALVGRSGAGKSTLADLILGVLEPGDGCVMVGGIPPGQAVRRWPGAIAYVPQDVMLANDSVRANVALGLPLEAVDDAMVWDALRRAHLADYVGGCPQGLDTQIGERGVRLSGGQRQRLGIARALFTAPRLLILDEATSALDSETEQAITDMLTELGADVTTVMIAHRLSTIQHVDLVAYLEDGRSVAQGSFTEVCHKVPALRRQAALMGLRTSL